VFSLGIDQHARPITLSLRDDSGDVVQARQVSTQPEKVHAFFQQLTRERLHDGESFVAVLEVCGFNDWLIRMLQDYRCYKVILIQPEDRNKCKTDRRDAAALSELLWVNRDRLLQGQPVRGLRQVDIASSSDQENRRLTTLRQDVGQARTRLVNKVRLMLAAAEQGAEAVKAREWTEEDRERRRQNAVEIDMGRYLITGYHSPRWTKQQLAMLGTMPDAEVAARSRRNTRITGNSSSTSKR
jgi:hypothetical protein